MTDTRTVKTPARVIVEARVDEFADGIGPYAVQWHGGHGLHLYNREGRELAYRTVGDQSRDNLTLEEAQEQVSKWADWINSGDAAALEF